MKKINHKGFSVLEGLLVLVLAGIIGFVGWYVYYGHKARSIHSYSDCVKAGGQYSDQTAGDTVGIHGECKIYGQSYIDNSYLAWDIGLRYSNVVHDDKLAQSQVLHSNKAPVDLVKALQYDNGGCAINDHKSLAEFDVLKVVDNKFAKIMYGCVGQKLDAYMIVNKDQNSWKEISPSSNFTASGIPRCAMLNKFNISKILEPKCYAIVSDQKISDKLEIKDNQIQ